MEIQKVKIVCPILHLDIDTPIEKFIWTGLQIRPAGDPSLIQEFAEFEFLEYFGRRALTEIASHSCFFLSCSYEDALKMLNVKSATGHKLAELFNANFFTFFLHAFLQKDNSFFVHNCYLVVNNFDFFYLNVKAEFLSTASGTFNATKFSADEFEEMARIIGDWSRIAMIEKRAEVKEEEEDGSTGEITAKVNIGPLNRRPLDQNRLYRAFQILPLARRDSFLPIKISYYIVLLECLLSMEDNAELSHKVSERVAFLLGGDTEEKKQNFKLIKDCYTIRSKFVHGQKLMKSKNQPMTYEDMFKTSIQLDDIVRRVLNAAVQNKDTFLDNDALQKHFNNLMFA